MPINEARSENHTNFEYAMGSAPRVGPQRTTLPNGVTIDMMQGNEFAVTQMELAFGRTMIGVIIGDRDHGRGHFTMMPPDEARRTAAVLIELADEIDAGRVGGVDG